MQPVLEGPPCGRKRVSILSPLRYPGSKRRLATYVADVIRLNSLRPKVFVEPFAGGASVTLQLLSDGVVESAVLGERDPLVASFWEVLFKEPEWLVEQVSTIEASVDNWKYFREASFRSCRDRALACIFLNRTSFSGILAPTAGPIGGYKQDSPYRIHCRFNPRTLAERIRRAASLRKKILLVNHGDWQDTLERVGSWNYGDREVFYYFDPPFYEKAARLYTHYFTIHDHEALHDRLVALRQPWLLSYDPAPAIQRLYSHNGVGPKRLDVLYSASAAGSLVKAQELIVTNLEFLPDHSRVWSSSRASPSAKKRLEAPMGPRRR